jgi:hypothetical protein
MRKEFKMRRCGSYDLNTTNLLKSVLEEAWAKLSPKEQACMSKSVLAERILILAAQGERDPLRLRDGAVTSISPEIDA